MSLYNNAMKLWGNKLWETREKYSIYIRFSPRVSVQELAKTLGRKGIPDFGTDRNNTLSASWIFTKTSKNFMLELKRQLLQDQDIKEVQIRKVK